MGQCSLLLVLLCFLLLLFDQPAQANRVLSGSDGNSRSASPPSALVFALKAKQIPAGHQPWRLGNSFVANKLYFRRNVSLVVSLSVGTPPQNVSMVLDTGSELSWLLCSNSTTPSSSAFPVSVSPPSFRPLASRSYIPVPCASQTCKLQTRDLSCPAFCGGSGGSRCHVALTYADGSTSEGDLAYDTFHVGQAAPLRAVFGCMSAAYNPPGAPPTTGLLGMNRGLLSLVSQMNTPRFSYCIPPSDDGTGPTSASSAAGGVGVLLLGDAASSPMPFPLPTLNYTPLIQISLPLPYFDRVAYSVQLEGIRVGNVLLPIPKSVLVPDHTGAGQTMVDSGTQFTFILGPAYTILQAEFLRQTKGILTPLNDPNYVFQGAFDTCFRVRRGVGVVGVLPPVTLLFNGAAVTVSGAGQLLYETGDVARTGDLIRCLTFGNSDLVPLEAYVIGHHHQQNVWVEYDLQRGRVGFAPVRCDLASQKLQLGE